MDQTKIASKEIWIFLSHSNEDYDKVRKVRNMLEELELRPIMFFLKCLNDDDEIDGLIKREIDCRTRFILCDSENARKSKWVQREIEYIKSQQKPYEIIDLSKNESEILTQLKEVRRRSKIFISYSRKDHALASFIYKRLSKYDYDVFIDYDDLIGCGNYSHHIENEIKSSVENGHIIALLTENGLQSEWVNREIQFACEYDKTHGQQMESVIPIVIGNNIPDNLTDLQCIRFPMDTKDLPDIIVDAILKRILSPGEILTYCKNFKNGRNHKKDIDEAERLGRLYYNFAVESDNANSPAGAICLGICYEEGIGVGKDLRKAYLQYSDPVSTDGLAREMAKRVHRKLYPEDYINTPKESYIKKFFNRLKMLFK
jgi:hypothetical protein